jgi:hypothetical protein
MKKQWTKSDRIKKAVKARERGWEVKNEGRGLERLDLLGRRRKM